MNWIGYCGETNALYLTVLATPQATKYLNIINAEGDALNLNHGRVSLAQKFEKL